MTGQVEEGLRVLAEMRVAVDHSGFRCLEAEIYRLLPPYTFFLLNGDMELHRYRHPFI